MWSPDYWLACCASFQSGLFGEAVWGSVTLCLALGLHLHRRDCGGWEVRMKRSCLLILRLVLGRLHHCRRYRTHIEDLMENLEQEIGQHRLCRSDMFVGVLLTMVFCARSAGVVD